MNKSQAWMDEGIWETLCLPAKLFAYGGFKEMGINALSLTTDDHTRLQWIVMMQSSGQIDISG